MDLKQLKSAIKQLAEEKKIDEEVLFETVESVFAAAYKKGYAKNSQVILHVLVISSAPVFVMSNRVKCNRN